MARLADYFKPAVAIGLYTFIDDRKPGNLSGFNSFAVSLIFAVTIGIVTVVVSGKVFDRPRIRLEWQDVRVPVRGPDLVLNYLLSPARRAYELHLKCEGDSHLARAIRKRQGQLSLTVRLSNQLAVTLLEEVPSASGNTSISQNVVTFVWNDTTPGYADFIDLSIAEGSPSAHTRVDLLHGLSSSNMKAFIVRMLMPIDTPVEHMDITRS